jgi:hypothetical protein
MLHRRGDVTEHEIQIIRRVVLDSLPWRRLALMRFLARKKGVWTASKTISKCTGIPTATLRLALEDLQLLGFVESKVEQDGKHPEKNYRPNTIFLQIVSVANCFPK